MWVESMVLALPLLLFQDALQAGLTGPREPGWVSDAVLSVGAGVYEELIFRLGVISLGSLVVIDLLRLPRSGSMVAIVLVQAGLFASYHHLYPASEPFVLLRFLFRTAAGIYLGGVFALRGFGVAAGCHAAYNLFIVGLSAAQE
jgi:membrane protease YdiL (CAAX protease family)